MSLLNSLHAELLKTRKTTSYYITLIGAAVGPAMYLGNVLLDENELNGKLKNPLNAVVHILSEMNSVALFPLFIIMICTLLPQIEYRNQTWKKVFTSPQTKLNIFLAKFLNAHLLILVFLIATHLFMFLSIVAINYFKPGLHLFAHSFDKSILIVNAANAYLVTLAVFAIQFWIGLRSGNFIAPIGIGLALWLIGTIIAMRIDSVLVHYFPYSFAAYLVSAKLNPQFSQIAWTSFGYALFFSILGFLDFRRRAE